MHATMSVYYRFGNILVVKTIYIEYERTKVQTLFEDIAKLEKTIGKPYTKTLIKTLRRFQAAVSYEKDILNLGLGKPHDLSGDLKGYCGISISANMRLIYKVKKADTIIVKGVCDYHGSNKNWIIP